MLCIGDSHTTDASRKLVPFRYVMWNYPLLKCGGLKKIIDIRMKIVSISIGTGSKVSCRKLLKGKGRPCTGTEALYRPYSP